MEVKEIRGRTKLRLDIKVTPECMERLRNKEEVRINKQKPLTTFLLTYEIQIELPPLKTGETLLMSTLQRTAAAAQSAMVAAKEAERACLEAASHQNVSNISNSLERMNVIHSQNGASGS